METWDACRLHLHEVEQLSARLLARCGEYAWKALLLPPDNASGINACEIQLTAVEKHALVDLFPQPSSQEEKKPKVFLMATRPCVDWHCDGIRDDDDHEMTRSGWTMLLPLRVPRSFFYELQVYDQHERSSLFFPHRVAALIPGLPVAFDQTLLHRVVASVADAPSPPHFPPCSHLFLTWQTGDAYAEEKRRGIRKSGITANNNCDKRFNIDAGSRAAAFTALAEEAIENDACRRLASTATASHHYVTLLDSAIYDVLAFRRRHRVPPLLRIQDTFVEHSRIPMTANCAAMKHRILELLSRRRKTSDEKKKRVSRCVFSRDAAWGLLFRRSDFASREAYAFFACSSFSLPAPKHAVIVEKGARPSLLIDALQRREKTTVIILPLQTRGGLSVTANGGDRAFVVPFREGFPVMHTSCPDSSCSSTIRNDLPEHGEKDGGEPDVFLVWLEKNTR